MALMISVYSWFTLSVSASIRVVTFVICSCRSFILLSAVLARQALPLQLALEELEARHQDSRNQRPDQEQADLAVPL